MIVIIKVKQQMMKIKVVGRGRSLKIITYSLMMNQIHNNPLLLLKVSQNGLNVLMIVTMICLSQHTTQRKKPKKQIISMTVRMICLSQHTTQRKKPPKKKSYWFYR